MERLLQARLAQRLGAAAQQVTVSSAGTWGLVGEPMAEPAAVRLVELGGDPSGFAAREVTPELIEAANLCLAATREHRAAIATMVPTAATRTLTLRELARLLSPVTPGDVEGTDPADRLRSLVSLAVGNRGLVPLADPRDDDIADPFHGSAAGYERAATEIAAGLDVMLDLLAPVPVAD
jgi:protein-tyrosine phosphatase